MQIRNCTEQDIAKLARMNKQLIEDEKSNNAMDIQQLEERMAGFLDTVYSAYFFVENENVVGYALLKNDCSPLYLRQFMIGREYRRKHYGTVALETLVQYLGVGMLDLEVLPWNEAGKEFWRRCGFEEQSIVMRYDK